MQYNELITHLNLDSDASTAEKLDRLKQWCHENISRDIEFTGNEAEVYEDYQNLAKFFLNKVLPVISKNISEKHEELDGLTSVQFAASVGFDQWLIDQDPNKEIINTPNQYLMTPLHIAALEGYYHTVKTLCDLGANPKMENKNKQLPIFSALILPIDSDEKLKARKLEIFQLLKTYAPGSLKHQDNSGNTVLHLIASYGYPSLIEETLSIAPELFKISNTHNRYPVHTAILDNQIECLRKFISLPKIENLTDSSGETALHYAAKYGSKQIIELCCSAFDNVDTPDSAGKTPLMAAAAAGNIEAMETLLTKGSDPTRTDENGNTLLHYAVQYYETGPTAWILNNLSDIEVNAQNNDGQTALKICEDRQDEEKSNLLKMHGATNKITFSI